jgi:hypothetical protein
MHRQSKGQGAQPPMSAAAPLRQKLFGVDGWLHAPLCPREIPAKSYARCRDVRRRLIILMIQTEMSTRNRAVSQGSRIATIMKKATMPSSIREIAGLAKPAVVAVEPRRKAVLAE